jgi:tRNA modification GTPase
MVVVEAGAAAGEWIATEMAATAGMETELELELETPPPLAGGGQGEGVPPQTAIVVVNKLDLGGGAPKAALGVSARTGEGLETLRAMLGDAARALTQAQGPPPLTQSRHRAALQEGEARLTTAQTADLPELRAEDLRLALRAIGRITGSVGVEDILDTLFARFCIGK